MFGSLKSRWEEYLEEHPNVDTAVAYIRAFLPPVNFITIHYTYFIAGCLFFSIIMWASSDPVGGVAYIDALFLVVSAFTDTGLSTINISELTTWQQVLTWILFIIGSAIWVSFWTVMARKHAFEKRFDHIVEAEREKRRRRRAMASPRRAPALRQFFSFDKFKSSPPAVNILPGLGTRQKTVMEKDTVTDPSDPVGAPIRRTVSAPEEDIPSDLEDNDAASRVTTLASDRPPLSRDHISFVPALPRPNVNRASTSAYQPGNQLVHRNVRPSSPIESVRSEESEDFLSHWKNILTNQNTSKRGQFYDLSSDEREVLGGCEYRALKVLAITVPLYGFVWQFLCAIALGAWIKTRDPELATEAGADPYWTGIFLSVSAFNNAGMSLLDTSMVPFADNYFPLIVVGILVLAGNTAYPLFLRLTIWTMLKVMQLTTAPTTKAPWKETLEFILKYPRRVYTTLFPSRPTWWLLGVLVLTNTIDWLAFEILNIGNPVTEVMSISDRIIAGWFQAVGKLDNPVTPPFHL